MSDFVFLTDGNGTITGFDTELDYMIDVVIPEYVAGERITAIGDEALTYCGNALSFTIPDSVTSIGQRAFSGTAMYSITIPNSVTSIGQWAFDSCDLLTAVNIPNSVTRLEMGVFYCCRALTSVVVPNSVTSIGQWAFAECESLTSVAISNNVTSIAQGAFALCPKLTTIYVDDPNNLSEAVSSYDWSDTGSSGITFMLNPRLVKYFITSGTVMDIADAIRTKTNTTDAIDGSEMADRILSITTKNDIPRAEEVEF